MEAEIIPSQEAHIALQQAKAKFLRHKLGALKKSWKTKTQRIKETQQEAKREQKDRYNSTQSPERTNQHLTPHELHTALRQVKAKKFPGTDGVTNDTLAQSSSEQAPGQLYL